MRLKLKSLNVTVTIDEAVDIKFNHLATGDFNLLISDNAQGKTRLFNMLNFLSNLFKDKSPKIRSHFSGEFKFELIQAEKQEEVVYNLDIVPVNGENHFNETVTRNAQTIFSAKEKYLFNEVTQSEIKNYFIPKDLPALSSINEPEFITINSLRQFFKRIVWISANKSRNIDISKQSVIPDEKGYNLSSVLNNWEKDYPGLFNEVMNEFKQCFPFIKDIFFTKQDIQGIAKTDLLTFNEYNIEKPIIQIDWSDGINRMLHLLMTPKIPFADNGQIIPPSLILVDEIENGLDFYRLKYIAHYLQNYADESQIIISSHSPLICDFVHPQNWIIVKRKGSEVNFLSPKAQEKDLDVQLDLFKHNHWDFYTRHISNSEKVIRRSILPQSQLQYLPQ